jgi:hypothetical protein
MNRFHVISSDGIRNLNCGGLTVQAAVLHQLSVPDHCLLILPSSITREAAIGCLASLKEYAVKDIKPNRKKRK